MLLRGWASRPALLQGAMGVPLAWRLQSMQLPTRLRETLAGLLQPGMRRAPGRHRQVPGTAARGSAPTGVADRWVEPCALSCRQARLLQPELWHLASFPLHAPSFD